MAVRRTHQTAYRLVVRLPNTQPREIVIGDRDTVLGRDASCDIVLPTTFVSRRHARLTTSARGVSIVDEGSTNGTLVNGERVVGPRLLASGDCVAIGDVIMEVWEADAESGDMTTPLTADPVLICDPATWNVWIRGELLAPRLSPREFELLRLLAAAPGAVRSREELGAALWGAGKFDYNMLNQLLHRVRRRIDAHSGIRIENVPRVGYRIQYDTNRSDVSVSTP